MFREQRDLSCDLTYVYVLHTMNMAAVYTVVPISHNVGP